MSEQLHRLSAVRLRDALRARELSAVEILEAHLRQIEAVNPRVNAIVALAAEQAMETAHELDGRAEMIGPLHGIPVAIKDLNDTAGIRTSYGSPIYADHVPTADALLVERLRDAGAVIVGKTNVPEFGCGSHTFNEVYGVTRNPWDLSVSAGGSSGGAAAALAAGMLPLADGSDLGGSLRNPAAFCSVVGLRPSPGVVPEGGDSDPWDQHSVLGPMARSVADVALMMSAIAGPDRRAPLSCGEPGAVFAQLPHLELQGLTIAWDESVGGLPIEPEIITVLRRVLELLEHHGARVEEVTLDLSGADDVFQTFRSLALLSGQAQHGEDHPELLKPEIHDELAWGRALTVEEIVHATEQRTKLWNRIGELANRFSLLAMPVTQVLPFDVDLRWPREVCGQPMERYYTWMRSCSRITSTTLPAISLPAGFSSTGLPIGLQLVGGQRGDVELLSAAAAVEAALDVPTLSPLARDEPIHGQEYPPPDQPGETSGERREISSDR
jgi:amidase